MGLIYRRMTTTEGAVIPSPFKIQITVSAGTVITIPIGNYGNYSPSVNIDWGDSTANTYLTGTSPSGDKNHTYSTGGTYIISMSGFVPSFSVNNSTAIRSYINAIIQFGNVGLRKLDFYGCSNLTSIPASTDPTMAAAGGYNGFAEIIDFSFFAANSGLTAIPSDLFQYATKALRFSSAFQFSKITSIPTQIFQYNTLATTFSSCFLACTLLTSVNSSLFAANTAVVDFSRTFQNCRALTNVLEFAENTAVTTFNNTYYMGSVSNALLGNAPTLWTRSPVPYGVGCFFNCTGLTNYPSIPSTFR